MVPPSLSFSATDLAAITILTPSWAKRKAMALPIPRLAPVISAVLFFRDMFSIVSLKICLWQCAFLGYETAVMNSFESNLLKVLCRLQSVFGRNILCRRFQQYGKVGVIYFFVLIPP